MTKSLSTVQQSVKGSFFLFLISFPSYASWRIEKSKCSGCLYLFYFGMVWMILFVSLVMAKNTWLKAQLAVTNVDYPRFLDNNL